MKPQFKISPPSKDALFNYCILFIRVRLERRVNGNSYFESDCKEALRVFDADTDEKIKLLLEKPDSEWKSNPAFVKLCNEGFIEHQLIPYITAKLQTMARIRLVDNQEEVTTYILTWLGITKETHSLEERIRFADWVKESMYSPV